MIASQKDQAAKAAEGGRGIIKGASNWVRLGLGASQIVKTGVKNCQRPHEKENEIGLLVD